MKTIFWLLLALFFIIYSSEPTITFKPFSIVFGKPYIAFAFFFWGLSLYFYGLHFVKENEKKAYEKYFKPAYLAGRKDGIDATIEFIKRKSTEKQTTKTNDSSK